MSKIDENEIRRRLKLLSQIEPAPEAARRATERVRDTLTNEEKRRESTRTWRTILKSPITKLAAAVIIVVVLIGLSHFRGSIDGTSPAYGISDVPELLRNAKTLHVKGSRTYILKGQEPISCPVEYWMDFENLRYRKRGLYRGRTKNGGFADDYYKEEEVVFDSTYIMVINHTNRTVRFGRHTPFRSRRLLRAYRDRDVFLKGFYLESDQLDGFDKTGEEEIDGVVFDIWEKKEDRPLQRTTKYWIAPRTGELGRYSRVFLYDRYVNQQRRADKYRDRFVLLDEDKHEWHEHVLTRIERNKPLPDDIFKLETPAGYTVTTSKDEAPSPGEIGYSTVRSAPGMTVSLRYTLSEDGSVIMAWSDRSKGSSESQAALFEGLEPGGPLPELTFVPYALHPLFSVYREKNESITYVGRHLTHTKRGNVYYEWIIYVPDSEPPRKSDFKHVLTYDALVRRNPDNGKVRGMGLIPDTTINSAEEFDALVLGGMAELSDDGKPPEGLTYDSVLELARQIRESLGD